MSIFSDKVTTALELPGHRVVANMGVALGAVVRSRSFAGSLGAAMHTLFGGSTSSYARLCEQTRDDAYQLMLKNAREMGANAIIGMRYDATELGGGVTEVIAYGSAVKVEELEVVSEGIELGLQPNASVR